MRDREISRGGSVTFSPHAAPFAPYLNPTRFVRHFWAHRSLIAQFTQREVEGRYRSSLLGLGWSFVNPLVLLLVYTFVFGVVFKQRWPGMVSDNLTQFGLVLFAGLIMFGLFSECVTRAPGLIVSTPNYVKRVVFPLEFLPVSVLGSAMFHAAISLTVLLGIHLALGGAAHWTWLLIPLTLLPIAMVSLAFVWVLSSLGVFLRDLGYTVTLVVQVLFFVTPIFYPIDAIPEPIRRYVYYNPLTGAIQSLRSVIFAGTAPEWTSWLLSLAAGLASMLLGYAWFMRTRRAFGDVI